MWLHGLAVRMDWHIKQLDDGSVEQITNLIYAAVYSWIVRSDSMCGAAIP